MGNENGTWIMRGLPASDPRCIHTVAQLCEYIEKVGFLPLFCNDIPGFSVEEHTESGYWWSGDAARDPWEWRAIIAAEGKIAYGKFFDKKAGFISKKWLPVFANHRRDGYDFDALFEDEKATFRMKKIMDPFEKEDVILSNELKELAGFGKGGEKNYEGVLTELQMRTYLCVREFAQRQNKKGEPYGWAIAKYTMPERIFGYEILSALYKEDPKVSKERIDAHVKELYPGVTERQLRKL